MKHSFIPISGHASVRAKSVIFVSGALVALLTLAYATDRMMINNPDTLAAVARSVVVAKTNDNRVQSAGRPLRVNPVLQRAAQAKAQDMATKGYFAHTSPEGRTPWYWFEQSGYTFTHAGENLAVRFTDSDAVVRAWMKSEGHRANILNKDFTETGIGIATGMYKGKDTVFVAQLFGTPAVPSFTLPAQSMSTTDGILVSMYAQVASLPSMWGGAADRGEIAEATTTSALINP